MRVQRGQFPTSHGACVCVCVSPLKWQLVFFLPNFKHAQYTHAAPTLPLGDTPNTRVPPQTLALGVLKVLKVCAPMHPNASFPPRTTTTTTKDGDVKVLILKVLIFPIVICQIVKVFILSIVICQRWNPRHACT